MSTARDAMLQLLRRQLTPGLHQLGFTGTVPHFRRIGRGKADFLSVQFDKWGGGFVLEVGHITTENLPDYLQGQSLEALTSFHLPLSARARLQPARRPLTDGWFRYDRRRRWWKVWARDVAEDEQQQAAMQEVLRLLPQAEAWWAGRHPQPDIWPLR